MAKRAQTGLTRKDVTDEQFACICHAFDVFARVKRRMRLKALENADVERDGT